MAQPASSQRNVGNAQFGNNTTIHQDNNTITQNYNLNLPLRPVQAAIQTIPYALNEQLVDRPDLVDKLNSLLPQTSGTYHSAALWGLGGSGKTQIALDFAYQRYNRTSCPVFWVHADNEATFSQDYKRIAKEFRIDENLESEELLAAVCDRIAALPDWVLILDNADDLKLFGVGQTQKQRKHLLKYIPHATVGTVLWTSRDGNIDGTLVDPGRSIGVARMKSDEAKKLLDITGSLTMSGEETEIASLLEELQWLPLAIAQAGTYMKRASISAKEYSSLLAQSKRRWVVLKENKFDRHRRPNVPNNVLETWSISITRLRLESKTAYRVLQVIAYLANQNISHEIITAAVKRCCKRLMEQSEELEAEAVKAIARLKDFSFIGIYQMEDGSMNYEIHKLVQEATRYGLSVWKPSFLERFTSKKEGERYFSSIALQVIDDLFPDSQPETWTQCDKYLAHALQIGNWADLSEKQIKTIRLLNRVSKFLSDRGRWREGELVNKRELELYRKMQGERHLNTIICMQNLAITYYHQGRYSKAESILVQVLDLMREILGDRHPDTIAVMADLASSYHGQGLYKKAEVIKVQVLDLRREILGDRHPDTVEAMGDLASIYYSQGLYNKAEAIMVQVLDLKREILGDRHPDTLAAMHSLGSSYHNQGLYNKAEAIMVQVLDLRREILGDRHPDTLAAMHSLGSSYYNQGLYNKAEAIIVQVLDLRREILGDRHPDTLAAMHSLGSSYYNQGLYNKAKAIIVQVLDLRREILGDRHPKTVGAMGDLASSYHSQGLYSKAEPIMVQVLDLSREILGKEHPGTLRAMKNLAYTWDAQGRHQDAIALLQECVQYRRSVLGPEHPDTVNSVNALESWKSRSNKQVTVPNTQQVAGQSGDE